MSDGPIDMSIDGVVAALTLNRPATGNAIDLDMAKALFSTAVECDSNPAIRCVAISGSGRFFCVGGDIGVFSKSKDDIAGVLNELARTLHEALSCFARMRKPLVTLVNGPAAGAGLSLALAGDYVLAARSAHFTAAYTGIGLTPDGGMTWRLPRLIGLRAAQDLIFTNRRVDADEAGRLGLVTRVVDDAVLTAEGRALARTMASGATHAFGGARNLLAVSFENSFEKQMDLEAHAISSAGRSAEAREGIAAFLAKRKPDFSGGA